MFIIRQIVLNVKIFFSSVKLLIHQIFCKNLTYIFRGYYIYMLMSETKKQN